jgi:CHASE2 domain-containing sensor protein
MEHNRESDAKDGCGDSGNQQMDAHGGRSSARRGERDNSTPILGDHLLILTLTVLGVMASAASTAFIGERSTAAIVVGAMLAGVGVGCCYAALRRAGRGAKATPAVGLVFTLLVTSAEVFGGVRSLLQSYGA